MSRLIRWSHEEDDWLAKHLLDGIGTEELTEKLNARFGNGRTTGATMRHMSDIGLTRGREARPYTQQQRTWIYRHFDDCASYQELVERFNSEFGQHRTVNGIQKLCRRSGLRYNSRGEEFAVVEVPVEEYVPRGKMSAGDYRRTCSVCGRKAYVAHTILHDGKPVTYCDKCYIRRRSNAR